MKRFNKNIMNKFVVVFAVFAILLSVKTQALEKESLWDKTETIPAGDEYILKFKDIELGDTFIGAFQTENEQKIDFSIIEEYGYSPLERIYMTDKSEFNVTVSSVGIFGSATYCVIFDNTRNNEDTVVNFKIDIVKSALWDGFIVIPARDEYILKYENVEGGDSFVGAFQTQRGEKIYFYIQRERSFLELTPLRYDWGRINKLEFNITVRDPGTFGSTTYYVVFGNGDNDRDVIVRYRLNLVKSI